MQRVKTTQASAAESRLRADRKIEGRLTVPAPLMSLVRTNTLQTTCQYCVNVHHTKRRFKFLNYNLYNTGVKETTGCSMRSQTLTSDSDAPTLSRCTPSMSVKQLPFPSSSLRSAASRESHLPQENRKDTPFWVSTTSTSLRCHCGSVTFTRERNEKYKQTAGTK